MPHSRLANASYRPVVAALADSEERYRLLVEGVRRYAIFMLDPKGAILTWNRGLHELLGYNDADVLGKSGAMLFTAADRKAGLFKRELGNAKRSGESVLEHHSMHKDGSEIAVQDTMTPLMSTAGKILGFAKVTRRLQSVSEVTGETTALELAKALAAVQMEVDHRRRLEVQLLNAVEEERERLGRDLHDDLSQHLAGLAMMLDTVAREIEPRYAAGGAKVRKLAASLNDAVAIARNLSRGLHPVTLTHDGLPAALAELAERVPQDVVFSWPKSQRIDLDPSVALHVYRIAEEAMGNAIRHSDATKISITLEPMPRRQVRLIIADDGKGFSLEERRKGMGLQNMNYRAGAIGGAVKITSAPGRGTRIACTIPLRRLVPSSAAKRV